MLVIEEWGLWFQLPAAGLAVLNHLGAYLGKQLCHRGRGVDVRHEDGPQAHLGHSLLPAQG